MSITKIIIVGDPHFKVNNVAQTKAMGERIVEIVKEVKPDFVVIMGDTLDRHSAIHVDPLDNCRDFLEKLSLLSDLYILIGNHDRPNNSTYLTIEHPFNALKRWPRTTIIDTPMVKKIKDKFYTFVPYVFPGRFHEALTTISEEWKQSAIIFAHQEFRGAKMENGLVSSCGDPWPDNYPIMISGHIHEYQQLKQNLIYVGTPIQHSFGESPDKAIMFLTIQGNNEVKVDRIGLGFQPRIEMTISVHELSSFVPPENCILHLKVTGTTQENRAALKFTRTKELKKNGIKISFEDTDIQMRLKRVASPDIDPKTSYGAYIHKMIQDKPEIKKIYEEIFGTAPEQKKLRMNIIYGSVNDIT